LSNNSEQINFDTDKFSLDSSVVIAFFKSSVECVLKGVFKKIYFSSEIIKELRKYDLSVFDDEILDLKDNVEFVYFLYISSTNLGLSVADTHLITICKFNNLVCVSFEKKIRSLCEKDKIKNIGLLQILQEAIRLNLINREKAKNMVLSLKNNGLYLDKESYNNILNKLDNC